MKLLPTIILRKRPRQPTLVVHASVQYSTCFLGKSTLRDINIKNEKPVFLQNISEERITLKYGFCNILGFLMRQTDETRKSHDLQENI